MTTPSHPRVLVTGAGGFIGNHLVMALKRRGFWVRGVDLSLPEYTVGDADEFGLGWEPSVRLHQGLEPTYRWIEKQVTSRRPPWAAAGR